MKGHDIQISQIQQAMFFQGFKVFEGDEMNFNLNLIGVRSKDTTPNKFNDWFLVLWKYLGNWNLLTFQLTTDPGTFWLGNDRMGSENGTAILKPGQYFGLWMNGYHKEYSALVQKEPCTVIRDYDKDGLIDYDSGREERGLFGINCHRASEWRLTEYVGAYSAGCQVHPDPDNFDVLTHLRLEAEKNWGNSFTYTLLKEEQIFENGH